MKTWETGPIPQPPMQYDPSAFYYPGGGWGDYPFRDMSYPMYVLLRHLKNELCAATHSLAMAVAANSPVGLRRLPESFTRDDSMNPILQQLADQVTATVGVVNSATTLINGFAQRITDAVNAALANGATADQLAPITDEIAAIKSSTDALAAAVAANTPAPPPGTTTAKKP